MKTKIEIKSYLGTLLFEYESTDNTIMKTLEQAVISRADLYRADLRRANLRGANLRRANLSGADLRGADLRRANLRGADLRGADLSRADLSGADLRGADLYGANLSWADLYGANLRGANLRGADFRGADLRWAKNVNYDSLWFAETRILSEGDLIGYKKCLNDIIVKLLIPKEAKRSHAFGRKCRCEYAKVLEIFDSKIAYSTHDSKFEYKVGKTVKCIKPFSENWQEECESGIHFFITKIEAENY